MLFDRDEDGVLSIQELAVVMKSLGQRPTGPPRSSPASSSAPATASTRASNLHPTYDYIPASTPAST